MHLSYQNENVKMSIIFPPRAHQKAQKQQIHHQKSKIFKIDWPDTVHTVRYIYIKIFYISIFKQKQKQTSEHIQ